jgi:hypothetical protein
MIQQNSRSLVLAFLTVSFILACGSEEKTSKGQGGQSGHTDVQTTGGTVATSGVGGTTIRMSRTPASNGGSRATTTFGTTVGGNPSSGGTPSTGGNVSVGGSSAGTTSNTGCDAPSLVWKTANKTNYTSYPDPGSEECIKYNGCTWAGQFAACDDTKTEQWVKTHNIVAAFPDFGTLKLHDLCLRKGDKTIVVTVLDTCGDSDCGGCCTENKGSESQLIDIESYTDARWGVPDGKIEWADLGVTKTGGCN